MITFIIIATAIVSFIFGVEYKRRQLVPVFKQIQQGLKIIENEDNVKNKIIEKLLKENEDLKNKWFIIYSFRM